MNELSTATWIFPFRGRKTDVSWLEIQKSLKATRDFIFISILFIRISTDCQTSKQPENLFKHINSIQFLLSLRLSPDFNENVVLLTQIRKERQSLSSGRDEKHLSLPFAAKNSRETIKF